jgi:hypothetical protein
VVVIGVVTIALRFEYMVNRMVKLQFHVNDVMVVSSHDSFTIDGDLDILMKTL